MSAAQIVEEIRKLTPEEQRDLIERIEEEFLAEHDLTLEQVAELDRRAEDALANPGRGIPLAQAYAEIVESLRARK